MYHATETQSLKNILATGLQAGISTAVSSLGEDLRLCSGVYLFEDLDAAKSFRDDLIGGILLWVDVEGLELITDPEYDNGISWLSPSDIEPSRIRRDPL